MRLNMDESDAVEFDKFVEEHWGKSKVFNPTEYKEEKKKEAQNATRSGRKATRKLATEQ